MGVSTARIPAVKAMSGESQFSENVMVVVNCTAATVTTMCAVASNDASLVHFPSAVDLNDSTLINVMTIAVTFSTGQSILIYAFNNTNANTARSIADGFTTSISSAFSTNFVWSSTGTSDSVVNVTYTGAGKSNLPLYVDGLVSQCLAADLEGFSLTFEPMSHAVAASIGVVAEKDSGGFEWGCYVMTGYTTSIAAGSGNHLVDVLDLLNVDALAPSNYAAVPETGYLSQVLLTVSSDSSVSYVSSEPGTITSPTERGWFLNPYVPANTLMAWFYFGSSPSPQSPLTLTFGGTVLPELTTTALLVLFLASAMIALVARKRFSK
jgi:hypothetical protein